MYTRKSKRCKRCERCPDKRKVGGKISHYFLPSGLHVYKNDIDEQFIICESDDVDIDDNGRAKEFVHVNNLFWK